MMFLGRKDNSREEVDCFHTKYFSEWFCFESKYEKRILVVWLKVKKTCLHNLCQDLIKKNKLNRVS